MSGSGIMLTNNEIKDVMKVTWSFKNRGILLKGATRKIPSQEEGFLSFLRLLMAAGSRLVKNELTPLAKSVGTLRINGRSVNNKWSYSKENFQIWNDNINNLKGRNK